MDLTFFKKWSTFENARVDDDSMVFSNKIMIVA